MTQFHTKAFLTPEERIAAASLPKSERQMMIKSLLYRYPGFKKGLKFIEDFHRPASDDLHDTGVIGGLLGESRAGKTMICRYFTTLHQNGVDEDGETFPIVYLEATEQMTPTHMADRLYYLTGARSIPMMKQDAKMDKAVLRLAAAKTELLIIDDAQNLFWNRPQPQLRVFRGFLKALSDANLFNILLVGEERLNEIINEYSHLANRGGFYSETIEPLGDSDQEFEMFRLLLDKIDERLPFAAPSGLNNAAWAKDFHYYSQGKIGRLMNLISRAAMMALKQDTACVMVEHLREAVNGMRKPGDHYRYFERS
jgi:type II secretory pathway predicted ATPase ExeA